MSLKKNHIFLVIFLLVGLGQAGRAAFTGSADDRKNKVSLRSLGKMSKAYSLSSLRSQDLSFSRLGITSLARTDAQSGLSTTEIDGNPMLRVEKGNTTYIYPYPVKVKVSRFKAPSATGR